MLFEPLHITSSLKFSLAKAGLVATQVLRVAIKLCHNLIQPE
jgi:hypothetical protein